jgi:hypothetical protein
MSVQAPVGRLLLFLVGAAAGLTLAIAAGSAVVGAIGPTRPLVAMAAINTLASMMLLAVTAALLRFEGTSLRALGLPLDRRRFGELGAGFVVTAALFLAVAAAQSAMVGATWHFSGAGGVLRAAFDLPLVLSFVLAEELLFRGAALRSLRAIAGDRAAVGLTAVAFGLYHVLGTESWAMGAVVQFLMPAIGGLLFAWAAVRSGGLALPIGLHLGGNWVQSSVAVFGPAPSAPADAVAGLWRIPITAHDVQVLTAPDLLPRLPMLLAFAIAAAAAWRLSAQAPADQLFAPPKQ